MKGHRLSFGERRRRMLNRKIDRLDRLETRNTITEPISILGLSVSALRGMVQLGIMHPNGASNAPSGLARADQEVRQGQRRPARAPGSPGNAAAIAPGDPSERPAGAAAGSADGQGKAEPAATRVPPSDVLPSIASADSGASTHGISVPWQPTARAGGGAALPPRGGSGGPSPARTANRGSAPAARLPQSTPAASGGGSAAALLAAVASAGGTSGDAARAVVAEAAQPAAGDRSNSGASVGTAAGPAAAGAGGAPGAGSAPAPAPSPDASPETGPSSGGSAGLGSIPDPATSNASGPSQGSFPYFPLYVLDVNHGVVLFPGVDQLGTAAGSVILQAQVSGTTVSSYDWNTAGISSDASSITGSNTYQLSFQWNGTIATSHVDAVTLSVTDSNSHTETYTYDFQLAQGGSGGSGGGNATWPTSYAPNTIGAADPAWPSDDVSVDSNSGALDTAIPLPSYNPNVPALDLTYDSLTANPLPIIIAENTLSSSSAVPSQVGATLTFNGTVGTTYYYNTSTLNPGDVQQIALQAATAGTLSTGRYAYSMQIVDYGATNTTITLSGTATLLNESSSAFGDGWTLDGLEQIIPASGGVILSLGGGGDSLWFTGSFGSGGGTYTTPAGDFSTLVLNSNGSYTRTLTDGTQVDFNSGGYEIATVDLNGLHTTYGYTSNRLTTITDPYTNVTSFTYNGSNLLESIEDPAARLTTFTMSSGNLTAAQQADGTHITYTYGSSGQMTQLKDPLGDAVTVTYDSAGRVGTITRPDLTTEEFSAFQEQGWTNTGTSGSPAPAALLAASAATYSDPNGNVTSLRPDWYGLGMTGVAVDALGDVGTFDLNSNGLATVVIDPLNRMTTSSYNSLGNMIGVTNPDGTSEGYTYNGFSEPLTAIDENGKTTSYTYDGNGNNTVIEDPMLNLTTMTYTATGQVRTVTNANDYTTTYLYDSLDRLTTIVNADGTTEKLAYNNQGNVIQTTDERNNATTFSFDALNRETGMTDALGDITTYVYDADGDLTKDEEPTPAGQTARTTNYTYNSMNELTVATDPLGHATSFGYDPAGNQVWAEDPMERITTTVFDALNRPVVVIDPMLNRTTTTYDADDEVVQTVDPMGRITTATFSDRGWVPTVTDPLNFTSTYSYSPVGQTLSAVQKGTSGGEIETYSYGYNPDQELTSVSDPLTGLTSYAYDSVGNLIATTDPNGNIVSYSYDSINQLTTVTQALGVTTVYGYDPSGNQITVTDALGHTATTLYDALDRPTTLISATGGVTTITYDAAGRETSLTDPDGNKTQWAYDADDRVTTVTEPNGHTVTYVYNADDEVVDTTDADGRRTTLSYNADGDQTGETWVGASPAEKITYTYDADNEMTGASDSFATLTFTYDADGDVQTAGTAGPGTGQASVLLSYTYDAAGSETSLTDNLSSAGITTYSYDLAERITGVATSFGGTAGPQVALGYDSGGRLTSADRTIGGSGDSVNTTYGYDAANRQTTITDSLHVPSGSGGGTTTPIATYVYGYDSASRVTTEVDAEGTYTYTYDNANELTKVDENGTQVEAYGYDSNGNRTGTGYSTTVMNETATSPGITYTYDNAGNMISARNGTTTTTYVYDFENRLTEVKQNGTVIATYVYDALNRRIGVDDNGTETWTVYDGTNPYADFSGSGALEERYLYGPGVVDGAVVDELLARTSAGGTTAWYLPDKLGSVRDIVSTSGTELDHVVYDSFGNIVTETDAANGDRFKYAGMEYDSTTGQYYDLARDFQSAIGRFTSMDPLSFAAGQLNLYVYVDDGPVNGVDMTGTSGGQEGTAAAQQGLTAAEQAAKALQMANEAAQKARQNIYYNKHWYDPRYWNDIAYLAQQLADTCASNQAIIQRLANTLGRRQASQQAVAVALAGATGAAEIATRQEDLVRAQQLTQQAQAKLDEGKARAANAERVQLITLKEAQIRPQNTTAVKFKDLDFGSMDAPTPPMGDRNRYTPNPYHPPPTMGDHNRYTPNPYHPPPTMGYHNRYTPNPYHPPPPGNPR